MKHTEGPWEFGGIHSWEVFSKSGGEVICTIHAAEEWQDGLLDLKHEREKAKANGHLIAVVPTLLKACQSRIDEWHSDNRNFKRAEPRSVKLAREAIAKAE